MIIKGLRVPTSSNINRLIRHLQDGEDNESVRFLCGTSADLKDMQKDARSYNSKYSIRHWIVAPHESITRSQLKQVFDMLATEFGFDSDRAVVVEHSKKRSTKSASDRHWHILINEVDPSTGRILKTSFDRIIHELVARVSEYEFGHKPVPGKHTKSVIQGLRRRNLECVADSLEELLDLKNPVAREAFSHAQHQEKKRLEIDLPTIRQFVKATTNKVNSRPELEAELKTQDLFLSEGSKPKTWVIRDGEGNVIGALHRLASKRKSEINSLLLEKSPFFDEQISAPHLSPDPTSSQVSQDINHVHSDLYEQLGIFEDSLLIDAGIRIPEYEKSQEHKDLLIELRNKKSELKVLSDQRWGKLETLRAAEKKRWWLSLFGKTRKQKEQISSLKKNISLADKKIEAFRNSISAQESKIFRCEKEDKDTYKKLVHRLMRRKRAAQQNLIVAEAAHEILKSQPQNPIRNLECLLKLASEQTSHINTEDCLNISLQRAQIA